MKITRNIVVEFFSGVVIEVFDFFMLMFFIYMFSDFKIENIGLVQVFGSLILVSIFRSASNINYWYEEKD